MIKLQCFAAMIAATMTFGSLSASNDIADSVAYKAHIGGLPLGVLELDVALDQDVYTSQIKFKTATFLSFILDADVRAAANGGFHSDMIRPKQFEYSLRDGKGTRNRKLQFDASGDPSEVIADPPFRVRDYSVTLDQTKGAVDPVTAAALLISPRAAACDLDVKIFDGSKLFRIALEKTNGKADGAGKIKCVGRYERLAGFKAKQMKPDLRIHTFKADLREVGPNRWLPIRILIATKYGALVVTKVR